ncbi:unnamed protein product [Cochlearia groenlandica]
MFPLESSPLLGVFTDATMIKETTTTITNQDSSGETCSISDPTLANGSAAKNDVVSCINIEDNKDKSWLRLGIGPYEEEEENNKNNTASSYKLQRCRRDQNYSLELSLFSSSLQTQPQPQQPLNYSHDQITTTRGGPSLVYNSNQFIQTQTLLSNRGVLYQTSKPTWITQYTTPFRAVSDRFCEGGEAGPSSEFRVLDPTRRQHCGLWFLLQASQFQEKEPFLPQVSKSYLRIKDGRITVRLLIKYLMKKLYLDSECEIEIRCRGQQLSPLLTMQHVRDTIWTPKSSYTLLRDSSTCDHVMILHYGRTA